jgi:hypothetical protein
MKEGDTTDKGRLTEKAEGAINEGNFAAARRAQRQIARREQDVEIRGSGKERDNRNIRDIAKDEGIETFGKNSKELREEIIGKRREKEDRVKGGAADPAGKDGKKVGGKDDKPAENPLIKLVTEIKGLMEKLEKKLPTPALRA